MRTGPRHSSRKHSASGARPTAKTTPKPPRQRTTLPWCSWTGENSPTLRSCFVGRWRCKVFGEDHAAVARVMNNLGVVMEAMGALAGAESLYRQSVAIRRKVLDKKH